MLKVEFGRKGRTPMVMSSPIEFVPNCSATDNATANDRSFGRSPVSSKLDATFEATFLAYAGWKDDKKCWLGDVALQLKLGVAGVASLGVRGSGFLRIDTAFEEVEGKEFPHSVVTIGAKVQVFIQVWFLKKTFLIAETPKGNIYDNWTGSGILNRQADEASAGLLSAAADEGGFISVSQDELRFGAGYAAQLRTDPAKANTQDAADGLSLLSHDDSEDASDYFEIYDFIRLGEDITLLEDPGDPDVVDPYDADGATSHPRVVMQDALTGTIEKDAVEAKEVE